MITLNKNKLVSVEKINKIKIKGLASIIRASGYYNQKAEKLKNFCCFLTKGYNGNLSSLFKNDIKRIREELLGIKGIGPETADSIILYAAEKPIFVIDAYTKRIFERIGFKERDYDGWQKLFMDNLKKDVDLFKEYHALLVELGKNYCKKNPVCGKCPLMGLCEKKIKQ